MSDARKGQYFELGFHTGQVVGPRLSLRGRDVPIVFPVEDQQRLGHAESGGQRPFVEVEPTPPEISTDACHGLAASGPDFGQAVDNVDQWGDRRERVGLPSDRFRAVREAQSLSRVGPP